MITKFSLNNLVIFIQAIKLINIIQVTEHPKKPTTLFFQFVVRRKCIVASVRTTNAEWIRLHRTPFTNEIWLRRYCIQQNTSSEVLRSQSHRMGRCGYELVLLTLLTDALPVSNEDVNTAIDYLFKQNLLAYPLFLEQEIVNTSLC